MKGKKYIIKCEANARLIGCAPEMLDVLVKVKQNIMDCQEAEQIIKAIAYLENSKVLIDKILEKASRKKWEEIKDM